MAKRVTPITIILFIILLANPYISSAQSIPNTYRNRLQNVVINYKKEINNLYNATLGVSDENLVLSFSFDDHTDDASQLENHGIATGNTQFVEGISKNAMHLDEKKVPWCRFLQ